MLLPERHIQACLQFEIWQMSKSVFFFLRSLLDTSNHQRSTCLELKRAPELFEMFFDLLLSSDDLKPRSSRPNVPQESADKTDCSNEAQSTWLVKSSPSRRARCAGRRRGGGGGRRGLPPAPGAKRRSGGLSEPRRGWEGAVANSSSCRISIDKDI